MCLNECALTTLTCSHAMCKTCIKAWLTKGCNDGCPLCRKTLYFKGAYKCISEWSEQNYEEHLNEVLIGSFDECIESYFAEMNDDDWGKAILQHAMMEDLKNIEISFNVLKEFGYDAETIDYLINEEMVMLSPRIKVEYMESEPVRKFWDMKRPRIYV